ncbi:MAG: PAS domain S-box protein, partial [Marmoricola sp.]
MDSAPAVGSDPTPGAGRGRSGRASRVYLLGGGIVLVCYLLFPTVAGSRWTFELVGLSALVAIATGVAWYRPRPVLPWALFILAQALFLTGDFLYYTFDLSFPSVGDGFYLAYYPLQAAGLLLTIRSRTPGRDLASLLDALIIAVGFGLLSWVYLIGPYTLQIDESQLSRIVSMAYPTMDVLLLTVATRLIIGNGARPPALHLMSASMLCLVLTDVVYGAIELSGTYDQGSWLDGGWMSTYLLWGAAALHPSMRDLSARAPAVGASLSGKRILLLAAATLLAPATLMANSLWPVDEFNIPVAAMASAGLFVLVLTRMLGLVSSLREAVGSHERAERHETILRHAATALTVAPDREHIWRAAVDAADDLVLGLGDVRIAVEIWADQGPPRATLSEPMVATVVSLRTKTSAYGQLVVTGAAPVPTDVVDGLHTLGAQVALALESAALTEDLSRQRSESRVGALVQNSSDVILVLDAGLVIRYVTPSVSRVFGHNSDDLIGTPLAMLVDPSMHRAVTEYLSQTASRPSENAPAEWRMRCGDGHFTDVETVSTNLLEHPSVNGIVVTARDIT